MSAERRDYNATKTAKAVEGLAGARNPGDVHGTLSGTVAVGGVPALGAVGASFATANCFSWFNYLNVGCHPYGAYPYNCGFYPGFAFTLGASWCWGNGCVSLGFGNPYYWCAPSYYCYPYYGSYCGNYSWYPYYPSYYPSYGSYPVYYPVYYPAYDYPSTASDQQYGEGSTPAKGNYPKDNYPSGGLPPENSTAKAKAQAPSDTTLADRYVNLGDVYFQLSRYDRALEAYEKAVSYDPKNPSLLFILSDALFANGRFGDAANAIRTALRLDPGLVESRADKRKIYLHHSDFEAQIDVLKEYLKRRPDYAEAWLVLGYNHYFRGELEPARDAFTKARDLAVDDTKIAADLFLAALEVRARETGAASNPSSIPASSPESRSK
jgi:tetratricopeptide (TPR) repeat protein